MDASCVASSDQITNAAYVVNAEPAEIICCGNPVRAYC